MIDRQNYADVQAHLTYRDEVFRDAPGTRDGRWSALRTLLIWADDTLLSDAPQVRPTFPTYLAGQDLAQSTVDGMMAVVRTYFRWAMVAHKRRYRAISPLWLETLQPPTVPSSAPTREFYTLDDVRALVGVTDEGHGRRSLRCRRIQAAVALLFVSAMRVGAFVTLPILALDVDRREVRQWTSLGVKTKFSKTATTHLLDIPDLMRVVREWDALVRRELPPEAMWYPNLSVHPLESKHVEPVMEQRRSRTHNLRRELQWLCELAGIDYLSPHHFRHGFVVHAEAHARTMADRKAISQTLMHSDLSITDGVYGRLKVDDLRDRVGRLGGNGGGDDREDVIMRLEAILADLRGDA